MGSTTAISRRCVSTSMLDCSLVRSLCSRLSEEWEQYVEHLVHLCGNSLLFLAWASNPLKIDELVCPAVLRKDQLAHRNQSFMAKRQTLGISRFCLRSKRAAKNARGPPFWRN